MCEAVIITPESAFSLLVKKASTGVGTIPKQTTLAPPAKQPETRAFSSIGPETLVSRATNTFAAFEKVTSAKPTWVARVGVSSTLTRPRTPELPKSFVFKSPSFLVYPLSKIKVQYAFTQSGRNITLGLAYSSGTVDDPDGSRHHIRSLQRR